MDCSEIQWSRVSEGRIRPMCRTRQEIIDTDTTLQDLILFIKQYEEELSKGKNGKIHFELAQARASLDTRIAQIQSTENMMEKFEEAGDKRTEIRTELNSKLDTCESNMKDLKNSFTSPLLLKSSFIDRILQQSQFFTDYLCC